MTENKAWARPIDTSQITAGAIDCSMLDGIDTPDGPVFIHRDTPADQRAAIVRDVLADRAIIRARLDPPAPIKPLWRRMLGL